MNILKPVLSRLQNTFLKAINSKKAFQSGFTMIELLVVIAVIGVLAVAVLSSINPIEQINKGRDTRTRSDAAQLINAVDRFFAIQENYPWNFVDLVSQGGDFVEPEGEVEAPDPAEGEYNQWPQPGAAHWDWAWRLVATEEVKEGYVNRLRNDDSLFITKGTGSGATMYVCFEPASNAFKFEARRNCVEIESLQGLTVLDGETEREVCEADQELICLP